MSNTQTKGELHVVLGAGPQGRTLATILANRGKKVRIVSRRGISSNLPPNVESHLGNLFEAEQAVHAMSGASAIYHCAAPAYHHWVRDFPALQDGIIAGASPTGAPLVMLDNLYGYGVAGTLTEDMPDAATGPKGRLRARMARDLMAAHEAGKIKATIARSADFLGPHARMTALGERFWPQLLQGKSIQWFGTPDAPHSFTYLPDLAEAMITLASDERALGRAWHVPCLPVMSMRDIAAMAAALADAPTPKMTVTPKIMMRMVGLFVPAARELIEVGYQFNDHFEADWSAYAKTFGGQPTDIETALTASADWWRQELGLTNPLTQAA